MRCEGYRSEAKELKKELDSVVAAGGVAVAVAVPASRAEEKEAMPTMAAYRDGGRA